MQNSSYDLALHKLIKSGGTPPPTPDKWIRPSEWPDISGDVGPDNKIVGLIAIPDNVTNNDSVSISFTVVTDSGTFSVDWGDGTSDTGVSSLTTLLHKFDKTSVNLTTTSYGYKVAKVIITADSGNLTTIDFHGVPVGYSSSFANTFTWLEIDFSASHGKGDVSYFNMLEHVVIRNFDPSHGSFNTYAYGCYNLKCFEVLNNQIKNVINFSNAFFDCCNLFDITLGSITSVQFLNNMFRNCRSLIEAPMFNTNSCTNFSNMFSQCVSLRKVPAYNTSNGTNFAGMFEACMSLKNIPLLDTSNANNMSTMFNTCSNLTEIPPINTSNCIDFGYAFAFCTSLKSIPLLDTSSGITFSNMFSNCYSLKTMPLIDLSNGTNFENMFYSCHALKDVPLFDLSSAQSISSMFGQCISLEKIPLIDISNASMIGDFLRGCISLQEIPALVNSGTSGGSFLWENCTSVKRIRTAIMPMFLFMGIPLTNYPALNKDALEEFFTNLPSGSNTIDITNCIGAKDPTLDKTIATSKGWTVVG